MGDGGRGGRVRGSGGGGEGWGGRVEGAAQREGAVGGGRGGRGRGGEIAEVEAAQHFEGAIGGHPPKVLCGDEGTAGDVREVDHVHTAGATGPEAFEGVVGVTHQHSHPRWTTVDPFTGAPCLRQQFRHPIFAVDGWHTEGSLQDGVQLIAHQFRSTAFHAAGLHDRGVTQGHGVLLREVEQREGDSQQQGLLPFGLALLQYAGQAVVLVEVGAAERVAAAGDELFGHVHERTTAAFQVGGQQGEDPPFGHRAVLGFKGVEEGAFIERRPRHMVRTDDGASRSAAGEGEGRFQPIQQHTVVAEQADGQAGDFSHLFHRFDLGAQALQESTVHGVVGGVQAK